MLTQLDIDELQIKIQDGEQPEVFYVCHLIEPRESVIDEYKYKSVSKFKVIPVKISRISNAYFEYLNYVNNKSNYHIEEEVSYYTNQESKKYTHRYIVPNEPSGNKDINPRMPSIIYGSVVEKEDGSLIHLDSPVKAIFTNALECAELSRDEVLQLYHNNHLNWKYMTLENKEIVDGIEYKYVTSNWYILECVNFPRTEHILINVKDKTAYFRTLDEAFSAIEQLEA